MKDKKFGVGKSYADILTVLLVIIIVAIIALLGFFTYKIINKKTVETDAKNANEDFLLAAEENRKLLEEMMKEDDDDKLDLPSSSVSGLIGGTTENNNSGESSTLPDGQTSQGNSSETQQPSTEVPSDVQIKKTYFGGYEVKGSISIPKTNCNYSILERVTVDSLNKSIAIMEIVSNPELNRTVKDLNVPGTNVFLMGHNYRNGQFFSNNDKLSIGDKIKITDQTGTQITYTIYDKFYTTPDDASFMNRDIDINTRELSIQTCNENSTERLILLAWDK